MKLRQKYKGLNRGYSSAVQRLPGRHEVVSLTPGTKSKKYKGSVNHKVGSLKAWERGRVEKREVTRI